MPPFAVFRADASPEIGGGHVQRCLALAEALATAGWRVAFATRDRSVATVPELSRTFYDLLYLGGNIEREAAELATLLSAPCDLLVLDHYDRGRDFETACRDFSARILVLEDAPGRLHDCDLLLDPTPGRRPSDYRALVPPHCNLLLGPDYALLRPQFAAHRKSALARREQITEAHRLLVSLGTTDPGNLTSVVLEGVALSGLPLTVDVVLGGTAPHLAEVRERVAGLISSGIDAKLHIDSADMAGLTCGADLAIGGAGLASFERCCLGLPSLTIVAADNQRTIATALAGANAAKLVMSVANRGSMAANIATSLKEFARDAKVRAEVSRCAALLCDGRGALRVMISCLAPLFATEGKEVTLRLVRASDKDMLFAWQQHPSTRRFAYNPQPPNDEEHDRWFCDVIANPNRMLLLILHDKEPAGVLRLDALKPGSSRVSIVTAPSHYRRGIAAAGLALARKLLPAVELHAEVLPDNSASHALFRRAGYREIKPGHYVSQAETTAPGNVHQSAHCH